MLNDDKCWAVISNGTNSGKLIMAIKAKPPPPLVAIANAMVSKEDIPHTESNRVAKKTMILPTGLPTNRQYAIKAAILTNNINTPL